ncbi:hypothetical protein [Sporolactobacillus inulinus]|uniref:Uncharacterized protein n=2 Tax=Sporolactobacillus inulinus TaxID=2078 RepID=A0A4Y3T0H1_9BACL|nr:hypothetical protein [Sporolactobacillus inulinus]KLI02155.1 hypothetical protein SINU_09420 [Sporolactobacillus inulinus CASD]GAY76342.1 hypothetical protein NBRC111894_1896 [Sporolactobacillus inulinus]GEB76231.1 hypothetical protein SIN01_05760 [Sporolactobacillus inulinus]
MKRIVIESLIVLSVLLFCALYGAVTVRDAAQPTTVQPAQANTGFHEQKIVIPDSEKATAQTETDIRDNTGITLNENQTDDSLSERVQRLFLLGISAVADTVHGVIRAF